MAYGTDVIPYSVGHCGIEPHLLTERFYRPLITPVTEASQFLYLVMVMLHRPLHVKQIRFYYANEAKMDPFYRVRNGPCISFVPPDGLEPSTPPLKAECPST